MIYAPVVWEKLPLIPLLLCLSAHLPRCSKDKITLYPMSPIMPPFTHHILGSETKMHNFPSKASQKLSQSLFLLSVHRKELNQLHDWSNFPYFWEKDFEELKSLDWNEPAWWAPMCLCLQCQTTPASPTSPVNAPKLLQAETRKTHNKHLSPESEQGSPAQYLVSPLLV